MVRKIERGTVIDHIPAWKSELVLRILRLDKLSKMESEISVAILENVTSKILGRKDVVKVDRWRISEGDADILCLVFPSITVNFIDNWNVSKYMPSVPDTIEGRIQCPELSCITNAAREPLMSRFRTLRKERALQCCYCDTLLDFKRVPDCVRA